MVKVGIYTLYSTNNFGAQLQAYALQSFLLKKGYEVEIVDYMSQEAKQRARYRYRWSLFKGILLNLKRLLSPSVKLKIKRQAEFNSHLRLSKHYDTLEDLYNDPPDYRVHLVGSDQVWNIERGFPKLLPHFLEFLAEDQMKMSYASSFGSLNIDKSYYSRLSTALKQFRYLSVREIEGQIFLKGLTGKDVQLVVDPTLLLSDTEWLCECPTDPIIKGKYILCYGCIRSDYWERIIKKTREQLKIPVVAISTSIVMPYDVDVFYQSAGPREFLNLFNHASFIITGSFHGLVFSLIFKKKFAVVRQGTRMARMESLINHLGLKGTIIQDDGDIEALLSYTDNIDYIKVQDAISNDISLSKEWLLSSLNALL